MGRALLLKSVVTRLVVCLVAGGLVLSAGLTLLELHRAEPSLKLELTQRTAMAVHNLRDTLSPVLKRGHEIEISQTLAAFTTDPHFTAVRLLRPDQAALVLGAWPDTAPASVWTIPQHGFTPGADITLDQPTLVRAPMVLNDQPIHVELLLDGPLARDRMREQVFSELAVQWLLLAAMTLVGLLLVRRWVTAPLSEIVRTVAHGAGPDTFYKLARQVPGEYRQLSEAIGGMLTRLECTTEQLKHREQAFESLYQFAPSAMVSLDRIGNITEANRRAADLLRVDSEASLIGCCIIDFIKPEDRSRLRQVVDRLDVQPVARAELRVLCREQVVDVAIECVGMRDADDQLTSVRLSLLDISQSKELQRRLADKSRLLNSIIDHMSDAILLVDATGRVAAHNQKLAALLHARAGNLAGEPYDPETFWEPMGVTDPVLFASRLRQIEFEHSRPAQERFETQVGTFVFQGIPVQDDATQSVSRLWVVQETTSQEQNERLIAERVRQLDALKSLGRRLADVQAVSDLMFTAAAELHRIIGVESVGLAVRSSTGWPRTRQIVHRGGGPMLLEPHRALVQSVEQSLMPQILASEEVTFWSELPRTQRWSQPLAQCGITCLAAAPLRGSGDSEGIVWIARRGGEFIDRHHLYLLEALAPLLAARIEFARTCELLGNLELTDPVTDLPSRSQLALTILGRRRSLAPWSVIVLKPAAALTVEHRRELAGLLRRSCRRSTFLAALPEARFAIFCPNAKEDDARRLADRLLQVLRESDTASDLARIPIAAGTATRTDEPPDSIELIDLAEERATLAAPSEVLSEGGHPHIRHAG